MRTFPWQSAVAAIVAVISCGLLSEVAADADCTIVEVTDKKGARLAKAEIVASYNKYDNLVFRTDRNGQVCIRNRGRATLSITPPQLPADSCLYEGEDERFPLDPAAGRRQRFQIERRTRMLPRAPLHGQIVSPSGIAVAGARVYVYSLLVETKDRTCFLRFPNAGMRVSSLACYAKSFICRQY